MGFALDRPGRRTTGPGTGSVLGHEGKDGRTFKDPRLDEISPEKEI